MKIEKTYKSKRPGKLRNDFYFIRTKLWHTSLRFQWLLCVTVALNWFITLPIPQRLLSSVPQQDPCLGTCITVILL